MTSSPSEHSRPYIARKLSLRELQKLDIHSFHSPKENHRCVRVVGLTGLALALRLEFDPSVTAYTERPRRLTCGSDHYEVSFWHRDAAGRETMSPLVPISESQPALGSTRRHRKAEQLLQAAEAAHLPLAFVQETDLIAQGHELSKFLRMLPSVQIAYRLGNRAPLRLRILDVVARFERCRISQLVAALDGYAPADVRCVVCDLVHSGLLTLDRKTPLHNHSHVWRSQS